MEESGSKGAVLLVDDDPDWLEILEKKLQRLGMRKIRAKDGLEAMDLLKKEKFNLVITDTNMPQLDGISLLKFIKSIYPQTPVVIFFSGKIRKNLSVSDLKKAGADAVLEKWDGEKELISVVKKLLGG